MALSYGVVTPVRDEEENLERLARCMTTQTRGAVKWIVVDDGSTDRSLSVISAFAREHPWIHVVRSTDETRSERGAPIVRAFHRALRELDPLPDVVVKLDADISFAEDHFEALMREFDKNARLGVGGGAGYEEQSGGAWRRRHSTGPSVWGAFRAYRRECLCEILPLEEHMGWDTLDLMKAAMKGWEVEVFEDLPFRHHRSEGERDGNRLRTYIMQGRGTYFMGYRISYLTMRALFRSARSPAAIGLVLGYAHARLQRRPRCADNELRAYIRREQSLRKLPLRAREALRPRALLTSGEAD